MRASERPEKDDDDDDAPRRMSSTRGDDEFRRRRRRRRRARRLRKRPRRRPGARGDHRRRGGGDGERRPLLSRVMNSPPASSPGPRLRTTAGSPPPEGRVDDASAEVSVVASDLADDSFVDARVVADVADDDAPGSPKLEPPSPLAPGSVRVLARSTSSASNPSRGEARTRRVGGRREERARTSRSERAEALLRGARRDSDTPSDSDSPSDELDELDELDAEFLRVGRGTATVASSSLSLSPPRFEHPDPRLAGLDGETAAAAAVALARGFDEEEVLRAGRARAASTCAEGELHA